MPMGRQPVHTLMRHVGAAGALVVALVVGGVPCLVASDSAGASSRVMAALPANVPDSTPFQCSSPTDTSSACVSSALDNIDYARSLEGVGPMTLPLDYATLTVPQQLLAIFDLERTARGLLPEYGLAAPLDQQAMQGAEAGREPSLNSSGAYQDNGSLVITNLNPLEADYDLMYFDGWAGSTAATINKACTSASSSACWLHRQVILTSACTGGGAARR